MSEEQLNCCFTITQVTEPINENTDLKSWFMKQQELIGEPSWLIAYADNGVVWGEAKEGLLTTAFDVFNAESPGVFPQLQVVTLQSARFFGEKAEIQVYRKDGLLKAVLIRENGNDIHEHSFTRSYMLWGNNLKKQKDGWSWLYDGQLGIEQAIPLDFPATFTGRPFWIEIRYYFQYEKDHGQARVAANRLVTLKYGEE